MAKKVEYPKLQKRFKARWVKALRSGEYKQGKGHLKWEMEDGQTSYCCLGVAADVIACEWMADEGRLLPAYGGNYLSETGSLLDIKLHDEMPAELRPLIAHIGYLSKDLQDILADKNDGAGTESRGKPWSFNRIATWIEKNL